MYYGMDSGCCYPSFSYGNCHRGGSGRGFALIVVLFILLIIVGCAYRN